MGQQVNFICKQVNIVNSFNTYTMKVMVYYKLSEEAHGESAIKNYLS